MKQLSLLFIFFFATRSIISLSQGGFNMDLINPTSTGLAFNNNDTHSGT